MRNLKKALALVLALMMALSLMATASASDYPDNGDITKNEAVDVMSAIGVFQGTDGGNFDAKGSLTRAQAAKIISYMKLGPDVAEDLPKDEAPFGDVKADRWYTGYVAYAKAEGIIAGRSEEVFDPNGNVTGYEFGKMVLEAAGISGQYTGTSSWKVNVASALAKYEINSNVGATLSANINREQACQMAFNALQWTDSGKATGKWVVNNKGTTVANHPNLGDMEFDSYLEALMTVNALNLPESAKINTDYEIKSQVDNSGSLADTVFGLTSRPGTTPFGAPANEWYDKASGETLAVVAKTPAKEYTTAVTGGTLYTLLGKPQTMTVTHFEDGKELNASDKDYINNTMVDSDIRSGNGKTIGGNGTLTQVYRTGATSCTIVEINTYVGNIGSYITESKNADGEVLIPEAVRVTTATPGLTLAGAFSTHAFTRADVGDTVLYTAAYDRDNLTGNYALQSVELAQVVTATPTREQTVRGVKSFIAGGETYYYSAKATASKIGEADVKANTDYAIVLDKYGYVIDTNAPGVGGDLAVVVAKQKGGMSILGLQYYAKMVFEDGTVQVVQIDKDSYDDVNILGAGDVAERVTGVASPTSTGASVAHIVSYTKDSNNVYSLTKAGNVGTFTSITTNNSTLGNNQFANSETVFVICSDVKNAQGAVVGCTYNVYKGIASVPTIGSTDAINAANTDIATGAGNFAAMVYVDANGANTTGVRSSNLVYVMASSERIVTDQGEYGVDQYYQYDAVINGEVGTVDFDSSIGKADKIYNTLDKLANGLNKAESSAMTAADGAISGSGYNTPVGNGIIMNTNGTSKAYYFTDKTIVYFIDGGQFVEAAMDQVSIDRTDTYVGAVDPTGSQNILTSLFITKESDTVVKEEVVFFSNAGIGKWFDDKGAEISNPVWKAAPSVTNAIKDPVSNTNVSGQYMVTTTTIYDNAGVPNVAYTCARETNVVSLTLKAASASTWDPTTLAIDETSSYTVKTGAVVIDLTTGNASSESALQTALWSSDNNASGTASIICVLNDTTATQIDVIFILGTAAYVAPANPS